MNNDSPSGALTQHNLISYIDNLSLHDHDNVTDCTRVATRSADMGHDRYSDPEVWLHEYLRTFIFLGWKLHQEKLIIKTTSIRNESIAEFLVKNGEKMNDSRQANAMIDTLDALKFNKPAILSLDNESHSGRRFQVAPSRYDSEGNLHLAIFNYELITSFERDSFLFWSWEESSAKLIQRSAYLKLDRSVLDTKRQPMEKALSKITSDRFILRKNRLHPPGSHPEPSMFPAPL
ncbi:hypothetical protein ACQKP5_14240 [Pseudomonas vancouverensis]|uniref:hypothetical protein n=1 Tax=Pseudomonas vancouverensis TaxID=95300 RepID=UPI003D016A43